MHQSIPAVPNPLPPGQPLHICSRCQSGGRGIRNHIAVRELGICVSQGDLRALHTRVLVFIEKDEAFVEQWLVCQGQDKLVDAFQSIFSQFKIFFITCKHLNISDNYILFIAKQSLTRTRLFRISHSSLASFKFIKFGVKVLKVCEFK